jgi:hypothetical protein
MNEITMTKDQLQSVVEEGSRGSPWWIIDKIFEFFDSLPSKMDTYMLYFFWGCVIAGIIFMLIYGATKDKKYSQRAIKIMIIYFSAAVIRGVMNW